MDELIGQGGMATVYRAHDELLGRDVAVKVFRASASADHDFQLQQSEIDVLASLNHPNLVTLLDAAVDRSTEQPRIFYAMELVEGIDLKRRVESGPMSTRQIAQIGYDVASGLEHVHLSGLVHRDIKPANILLRWPPDDETRATAKVGDFGIASRGIEPAIDEGTIVTGTAAYLSPEQARGDLVTMATDVYSLGLVLLQAFTRRLPFPGEPQASAVSRVYSDPEMGEEVPSDWRPLLAAMTERDPANRPPTREVVLALRDAFAAATGRHRAAEAT
jgi:serine/threonine protein kinase